MIGVNKLGENPLRVYQVYLDGKKVGLVEDKDELLNLINEEQQEIKDTYQISQVYPPTGFDILESITYNGGVSSANDIYQKIKNQGDFTIEGYEITITSPATEDKDEKTKEVSNDIKTSTTTDTTKEKFNVDDILKGLDSLEIKL